MAGQTLIARTRTVLQIERAECGAACLSMILQYYGQYVPLEKLRMETDVSRDGCSAGNIVRAAGRRGLVCDGYQMDAEELRELAPPCILWWEHNHFVVFEGVRGDTCFINDPAFGKRHIDLKTLQNSFSGIVLTFSPDQTFTQFPEYGVRPKDYLHSGRISRFLRSYRFRTITTVLAGLLSTAAALACIGAAGHLPGEAGRTVLLLAAGLICCLAGDLVQERTRKRLADENELQQSWTFLRRLFHMPVPFLEQRSAEDLVERVRRNDRISRFTADVLIRGPICAGTILLCVIFTALYSPVAAAWILITLILVIVLQKAVERSAEINETRSAISRVRLAGTVFSVLGKLETIRNQDLGDRFAHEAVMQQEEVVRAQGKLQSMYRKADLIRWILYGLCLSVAFLFIPFDSAKPGWHILIWLIVFLILVSSVEGLVELASRLPKVDQELGSVEDIAGSGGEDDESAERSREEITAPQAYKKLQGNIRCHDVSFAYGAFGEKIVKDLNLYLPVGSTLAVTGVSGSGKSTVGKLLGGLMEPSEGEILYDGRESEQIPVQVKTASIAMAWQKTRILTGTIRDNITMWNPNITVEEIDRAIDDACFRECVDSRPAGLGTHLGSRGEGLSGGERQRLEIARALAKDPSILILDEAFSAIDDELSVRIMANIRRRGCTCIVITHDPVLIDTCGQVLKLTSDGGDQ